MAKFDRTTLNTLEAPRPLYAGVGVADLAVEVLRGGVSDVHKRLSSLELEPKALRKQAAGLVTSRVQARRQAVEARVAELQSTYTDFVSRGETLVDRIRTQESTQAAAQQAKTASAKAKTTRTQATKAAKSTTETTGTAAKSAAKSAAKKTQTTARKQAQRPTSSAKATVTATKKAAEAATQATAKAAEKVGD